MVTKKKPVKKTVKKAVKKVVKKTASKNSTAKKSAPMKSFHIYKEDKPFVRLGVTRQTVYWLILLIFIIITQLWILKIQLDIANITSIVSNQ